MTGLELIKNGNNITLSMHSDNPESKNWNNLKWFKWIKGWMETMIKLNECGLKNEENMPDDFKYIFGTFKK